MVHNPLSHGTAPGLCHGKKIGLREKLNSEPSMRLVGSFYFDYFAEKVKTIRKIDPYRYLIDKSYYRYVGNNS